MTQVDRLTRLTSQLVGDIGRLEGVTLDQAGEQQLVQLLTDAFEQVGLVALERYGDGSGTLALEAHCLAQDCGYAEPHYHSSQGITII